MSRRTALLSLFALAGTVLYLAWSWVEGYGGFPLDDAWIHQTYARNLVEYGEWAFLPGQPSAGSTAPLWTLLLALGYALGVPFRPWAYALGGLCLLGTAVVAAQLAKRLWPAPPKSPSPMTRFPLSLGNLGFAVGLACVFEWHLVWAAVSGMETLLFALLVLVLWNRVVSDSARQPVLTGLLGGALILTRPEGVLAVGLATTGAILAKGLERKWRRGLVAGALMAVGTALVLAPYLMLNLRLSGSLWPNTLYAKQAEYAAHLAQPLAVRLWLVGTLPLIGGQVLLVPGLAWGVWREGWQGARGSDGRWVMWWLPLVWVIATVGVYALRLPVTYQHGRYLIPVIPVLLVYGLGGTLGTISQVPRPQARRRVLGFTLRDLGLTVWVVSTAILFVAFWFLGARAYATDVAIIEEEMVAVAHWLNANTESDALVAVHDIGAVGYFAQRSLLDLAGLVNPEVVPFIRDQERLLTWLWEQDADYLATFPKWYEALTEDPRLEEVYRTEAGVTVAQGGENMAVYALRWDGED